MKNQILFILFLFSISFFPEQIKSQLLQGEWRDHLSYKFCYRIAEAGNTIYCATQSGMLSYNKETSEVQKHSKVTGLSDVEVSTLAYSNMANKLIIGYLNGNIDIIHLTDGSLTNLADIKRKNITGNKSINQIFLNNQLAYLSTSFGIVVLDIDKEEIKDTYLFGEGGTPILVNDATILNNFIYAATESGIYTADLNSPNLVDHNFWSRLEFIPQNTSEYKVVEKHNGSLYALYHRIDTDIDRIIIIEDDSYINWAAQYEESINNITSSNGYLGISGATEGLIYAPDGGLYLNFTSYATNDIYVDSEANVFVAGLVSGFTNQINNSDLRYFSVNSPTFREVSKIETKEDHIWVSSGGPSNMFKHGAAYSFLNNRWTSYTANTIPSTNSIGNTYKFAIDPQDYNHVWAGAWGYGFIEFQDNEVVNIIEKDDLDIFNDINLAGGLHLRPVGIQYDNQGNLYILLDKVPNPLVILDNEGNWTRREIPNAVLNDPTTNYSDLLVTSSGQIWILSAKKGIVVLEYDGSGDYDINSFNIKNQDGASINKAFCLNEDNEGDIWVGTDNGPIIYYSPGYIMNDNDVTGNQIKISRNDGTIQADWLLAGETVLDIKTDGGNRKWIATANSGAFLFEILTANSVKTVHNFRDDNSPLFSNSISGIGINEKDGEVFFATNLGLLSFKGTATKGFSEYTDVYVYPNPVRPEYEGPITVTGLVENSIVKITDISGNLVYETTSLGGQAVWDGKNFSGRRVASGVYLVFLATEDGSKSHMTKLIFLH